MYPNYIYTNDANTTKKKKKKTKIIKIPNTEFEISVSETYFL